MLGLDGYLFFNFTTCPHFGEWVPPPSSSSPDLLMQRGFVYYVCLIIHYVHKHRRRDLCQGHAMYGEGVAHCSGLSELGPTQAFRQQPQVQQGDDD